MTKYDLKRAVEARGSYFFDRSSMRFFGDTMANYGTRVTTILTHDGKVPVIELYRRRPVKHGLSSSAYFRRDDFTQCWAVTK